MLLICWVATLYQAPRLFIKRLLTSNTACRLSDSTSVRNLPGAREKNLKVILLKPKGIVLKYASMNIRGGADFRLAGGSKHPAAHPHLSVVPSAGSWLSAHSGSSNPATPPTIPIASEKKHQRPRQTLSALPWVTCLSLNQQWHSDGRIWGTRHTTDTGTENRVGMPPRGSGENGRWPAKASARPPGLSPKQSSDHTLLSCHSILKTPVALHCCWALHNLCPPFAFSAGSFFHIPNHYQHPVPDATDYSLKIHWSTRVYACEDNPSFHFFLYLLAGQALIFNLTSLGTNFSLDRTSFKRLNWSKSVQIWKEENSAWNRLIIQGV